MPSIFCSAILAIMSITLELPTELVSLVVDRCESKALLALCLTNKGLRALAQRSLYRKVDLRTINDCVTCCRTFLRRPDLCESIREFLIMFESKHYLFPAFWNMVARALKLMPNLAALHFAMSGPSNIIFRDCTFPRLRAFSSVLDLSSELTAFLVRHPSIRQLCIGGETPGQRLVLPTSALPALETYLGSRALAQDVIPGRPVTTMTLAWTSHMSDAGIVEVVRSLANSSVPVRQFGCTTFGGEGNCGIVRALAEHMPDLYTLRISSVASGGPMDAAFVTAVSTSLQTFRVLHRLDMPCVVNSNDEGYDRVQESREENIARLWGEACPSLKVVTLPSCMTWHFEHDQDIWRRKTEERLTGFECF